MKHETNKGGNCKHFVNDTGPGIKPIAMVNKTTDTDGPLKGKEGKRAKRKKG